VHENVGDLIHAFRYDAHPMAKLMAGVASMQTFYPSSRRIDDPEAREMNIVRLLGKIPTMAAWSYRHSIGRHFVYPNDELGYVDNFLAMLFQASSASTAPTRACPGPWRSVHPARRPRAELLHQRRPRGGVGRQRPLHLRRRRHRRPVRAAARRRQRGRAEDAARDRHRSTASPSSSRASRTARPG
jgi:hypothetical protein